MGETFWIRIVEEDFIFAERAARAAFYLLDELERELNCGGNGQASRQMELINAMPSGEVMAVTQGFSDLWKHAETFQLESRGAFDVRAGNLFNYWAGRAPGAFNPDDVEWSDVFNTYKNSEYRLEGLELHAVKACASIDFTAILKGYAVDRIAETLESTWGVHCALVIAGSSVMRALDPPGEGTGWRVAVGSSGEQSLCRSAFASRKWSRSTSTIIDLKIGETLRGEGVVRAMASTACEAQYLTLMRAVITESEAMSLIENNGQRSFWPTG